MMNAASNTALQYRAKSSKNAINRDWESTNEKTPSKENEPDRRDDRKYRNPKGPSKQMQFDAEPYPKPKVKKSKLMHHPDDMMRGTPKFKEDPREIYSKKKFKKVIFDQFERLK